MPAIKEKLEVYFPTYLYDADELKGVILDASATYLPLVVGGNVEQQALHYRVDEELTLREGTKSLMVPALRTLREGVAKTRVFRITSEIEGGLSPVRQKLESNITKSRGRKRLPVWGREGAVDFLASNMPVRELEFSCAALQRATAERPSERKKLILMPGEESLLVIRGVQQTLLKGLRPTLRRGVEVSEQVYDHPTCSIADIDTRQSEDVHIAHFLDAVNRHLPVTLSASEQISISFSSYGDSIS